MYVNKCTKCGKEFETKNPKRVICPDCLYADKKLTESDDTTSSSSEKMQAYSSYDASQQDRPRENRPYQQGGYNRQQGGYNNNRQGGYDNRQQGGYNNRQGGYDNRQQGGYNNRQGSYDNRQQGGYNNRQGSYDNRQQGGYNNRQGGYDNRQGGYNRPQQGGYNNRPQGQRSGGFNRGGARPQQRPSKPLLVNREQLEQIELLYKAMLPLPNPHAHEVIGEKIGLEPRKVFFGINLIRQKMMLSKLPFPKRKLAISQDQIFAIRNLYEPMLPLPPIGCHKIIASQLRMDEWRVHVGIGLIRGQMGLDRWNQDREDAPDEFKNAKKAEKKDKAKKETKAKKTKKDEE